MSLPVSLPVLQPSPPKLSEHLEELLALEASGVYTNFGPRNAHLERSFIDVLFGEGACLTVCNATMGLMLAISEAVADRPAKRRYALMPSFTFAATAQAALWCGLTPLLCDVDPKTWLPSAASEEALLQRYAGEIAVIVPYATFGNNLDLSRYQQLSEMYRVPVVVDAAASLGSRHPDGQAFGREFQWPVVFSMHATKTFSVGEGGLIYCADQERVERLRCMASFGFGEPRSATMLGLNAKMSELAALLALLQLQKLDALVHHRVKLAERYREILPAGLELQSSVGTQVETFKSVLLPRRLADQRTEVITRLASRGVGTANYFSPHLAEQPYIAQHAKAGPLPVTRNIASRVLSLPLHVDMTVDQVDMIVDELREVFSELEKTPCAITQPKRNKAKAPVPFTPRGAVA